MFWSANSFNQDIGDWAVNSVMNIGGLFWATAFNQDLSGWCVRAFSAEPRGFRTEANSWTLSKPVWGMCPN